MEQIFDILIKAAGALVGAAIVYLANMAVNYLETRLSIEQQADLESFVSSLVAAAEQTLKKDDPNGSVRLGWVQDMLIDAGYELTDALMALVESKVYALNAEEKKK